MKKNRDPLIMRIPSRIYEQALNDLKRPHPFAAERVGFFSTSYSKTDVKAELVTITEYHPLEDTGYIKDNSAGAVISSDTIRQAMQRIIKTKKGCLHVHLHNHSGKPIPSRTDTSSLPGVAKSFSNVNNALASGFLIFSRDSVFASVKIGEHFISPQQVTIVGYPMSFILQCAHKKETGRYNRQTFLGANSEYLFDNIRIGIVGLGGGGSHIVQQLAHVGIKHYSIFDDDNIEDSNLNRLIGAWLSDVIKKVLKVNIAKRTVTKIKPNAVANVYPVKWQFNPEALQLCDIVVGCMDSYLDRAQLEAECRRYLIPYIDIGMDVTQSEGQPPYISGQVILSMPGMACMRCMQFITEEKLAQEEGRYGVAGSRPQVVWPNGVLASTAVGIVIDLLTNWTRLKNRLVYFSYDGNKGHVQDHVRVRFAASECEHYDLSKTGPVIFNKL